MCRQTRTHIKRELVKGLVKLKNVVKAHRGLSSLSWSFLLMLSNNLKWLMMRTLCERSIVVVYDVFLQEVLASRGYGDDGMLCKINEDFLHLRVVLLE